jgi:hypothetical protein
MKCAHCLRGGAQPVNMSTEVMSKIFTIFTGIGGVLFTGGEPSLNTEIINEFWQHCLWREIYPEYFYIVTNGKCFSQKLVDVSERLYNICDEKDICGLTVSRDEFHYEFGGCKSDDVFDRYMDLELPYFHPGDKDYRKHGYRSLIPQGRAENITSEEFHPEKCTDPALINKDGDIMNGCIYINVFGDVVTCPNMSYVTQKKYSLGNIMTDDINSIFSKLAKEEEQEVV